MYKVFLKRLFDIIMVCLFLPLWLIVMTITAILVYITMGTPILFKQERCGKDTKSFIIYKFRTMNQKTDQNGYLLPDDARLTSFGRLMRVTSLDELPEIINVLKGDMSIVGPRPLLIKYLPYYTKKEMGRFQVLPGITGLAQIKGRNDLSWDERLKLDLEYISNISIFFDAKIIFLTIFKVLKRSGIVEDPRSKMLDFDEERRNKNNS